MTLLINHIAIGILFEINYLKTRKNNNLKLKMEELNYVTSI
jgi:hypothetical protein